MKKFLLNNLVFFSILYFPFIVALVILHDYIPGPKITNSYSYNEKMKFIMKREINRPEIVAIGSSITLNNLCSDAIVEDFSTNSYLNMSSWGLRMNDSYLMAHQLINTLNPKKVIMMSSVEDFYGPTIVYNTKKINEYIISDNLLKYHYKYFHSKYFFKRLITNNINFNTNDIYKSLSWDNYGAVMLNSKNLDISKKRWNQSVAFQYIRPDCYKFLDSIASYLAINDVELIFVQTPIRTELISESYKSDINEHMHRIDSILLKNNQPGSIYCNDTLWSDELFVDFQHLDEAGAYAVTKYLAKKYFSN